MGKFDGYLICSDIDGTFSVDATPVSKNIMAVEYFIKNGGMFSIATGRTAAYLKKQDFFYLVNAPACICNGSVVYDYKNEKALRVCPEDFTLSEFFDAIGEWKNTLDGLYVYYTYETVQAPNMARLGFTDGEMSKKPIKVVCTFDDVKSADSFKDYCHNHSAFKNTYIGKSWDTGVEFNSGDATKGSAVRFIKSSLKNIHTLVAIGDYENDIPMLGAADIGVSVGNGLECVKKEADIIVCSALDGAVAELIEILEKEIR